MRTGSKIEIKNLELKFSMNYDMTWLFLVVIDEETKDTRAEVKSFDHSKLKHVETKEKESVPTADGKEHHSKKCLIL